VNMMVVKARGVAPPVPSSSSLRGNISHVVFALFVFGTRVSDDRIQIS